MSYMDQRVSSSTHPSSKREYNDYLDGSDEYEAVGPPYKRSKQSPLEEDDGSRKDHNSVFIKDTYPIPENCVGLVIGRNGSEIEKINQKSGCRVQVNVTPSTTGYRMVEIYGIPENIEFAKICIKEVVDRAAAFSNAPLSYPVARIQPQLVQQKTELQLVTIEIPIPANRCGSIIGKGGEMMRKLRTWSNCHMTLIQDDNIANTVKLLKIRGDPKSVEHAKQLVADILSRNEDTPAAALMAGNGPIATISLHIKVPRSTVGAIMGFKGTNIKKISDETGTKIQFLPDDDPKLMERSLVIIGNRNKVNVAAHLIQKIVEANREESNEPVSLFYMVIPASKCGLVIGRQGETIKQINNESGAHCELSRDPNSDPNEKTFVIRGSEEQVEHAKHMIMRTVGDIPPNTPYIRTTTTTGYFPLPLQSQQPNLQILPGSPIMQNIQQHPEHQTIVQSTQPIYQAPDTFQQQLDFLWQRMQSNPPVQVQQYNSIPSGGIPALQYIYQPHQHVIESPPPDQITVPVHLPPQTQNYAQVQNPVTSKPAGGFPVLQCIYQPHQHTIEPPLPVQITTPVPLSQPAQNCEQVQNPVATEPSLYAQFVAQLLEKPSGQQS